MKIKQLLKKNDIIDQKKYRKTLIKNNTEYHKNKNIVTSFITKKNIIPKLKEEKQKEEITKNKSNKNIITNIGMKKYLTSATDKLNTNVNLSNNKINNKINMNSSRNGSDLNRKSINYASNKNNNNKNTTKQLYINEIIPNNNKILVNHVKKSFLRANNFNTYQKTPKQKNQNENKECNISTNSHSQKNKNHKKIINANIKYLRKNNTELNNNYNTINNRSSSKSNKNIINLNNYKNKNNISSSADKQKNYSSLAMRTTLNNSTYYRKNVLPNKMINNDIYKKVSMLELDYDLENNISEINYTISNLNSNDFALCNSNSSLEEIYDKLLILCKEKQLTLAKIESNKFICKKDGDNSIKIEINKRGKTNVLKLYYLNGKEAITKEIIKNIILKIGF